MTHQITIKKNCSGTMEISNALFTAQLGYLKGELPLKKYSFVLQNGIGEWIEFNLYRKDNGEWFEHFMFPTQAETWLTKAIKDEVQNLNL